MGEDPDQARDYQVEIVEKAIKGNTIVCLGTGTGKTFISALVIRELQGGISGNHSTDGKRTFFIVNNVPLAYQQAEEIRVRASHLTVNCYTMETGVDFWKMGKWIYEFDNSDVLVMTAQVLANILTCGFIRFRNINLLVVDECHNATGNHPYVDVMEFHDKCREEDRPHILGLTASVINVKYKGAISEIPIFLEKKMKELESIMRSVCVTASDPLATVGCATKPDEIVKPYLRDASVNGWDDFDEINKTLLARLAIAEKRFKQKFEELKWIATASLDASIIGADFQKIFSGIKTLKDADVPGIAADAMKYCGTILKDLGCLSAYQAAKILIEQIVILKKKKLDDQSRMTFDDALNILEELTGIYEKFFKNSSFMDINNVIPMEPFISNKVYTFLSEILFREHQEFQKSGEENLHAIVFVDRRCTAIILSKLINYQAEKDPDTFGALKSNYILGHGMCGSMRLIDDLMRSEDQNITLRKFKDGEFNVLVSTSVVEEGLDVRKCNLVVRFSGIGTYRQYAQSKGRARSERSKFIVMSPLHEMRVVENELKIMQGIESVIFGKARNYRSAPTEEEIIQATYDPEKDLIPTYFVDDGPDPARITRYTCVSLLHRYCGKLCNDQFCSPNPYFTYETLQYSTELEEHRATVLLPLNFPLKERQYTGEWMPSEYLAKKSVAMRVCILLHKCGELDQNLLTISTDMDEEEEEDGDFEYLDKGTEIYPRKISAYLSPPELGNFQLFAINIVLSDPNDGCTNLWPFWFGEREGFGIYLPDCVPLQLPPITLYTRAGAVNVEFKPLPHSLIPPKAGDYHKYILEMCSKEFVNENIKFDFHSQNSSKGMLVPLKKEAFEDFKVDPETVTDFVDVALLDSSSLDSPIREQSVIKKTYLNEMKKRRLYYVKSFSSDLGGDIMADEKGKTYSEYYAEQYNIKVDESVQLLDVVPFSKRVSFTGNHSINDGRADGGREEKLVPDECEKECNVPASIHMQMVLLPYILYYYECILNATELRQEISRCIGISDALHDNPLLLNHAQMKVDSKARGNSISDALKLSQPVDEKTISPSIMNILESLTTRQARFDFDLERLEMIGDSFLKQAVTICLYFRYPSAKEGVLTTKRKRAIENRNLLRIAKEKGVQNIICDSHFGNTSSNDTTSNPVTVWLPPCYVNDRDASPEESVVLEGPYQSIKNKTLADSVEALIGVYFQTGGTNLALKFMQNYLGIDVLHSSLPVKEEVVVMPQSCYAEYPLPQTAVLNQFSNHNDLMDLYNNSKLDRLEKSLNYEFQDKSYLIQAVTHLSYPRNNVTGCYQRLEFLGDAVLDFLVTLYVFINKTSLDPGKLTQIRSALVNNNTFALLAIKHGFDTHIKHFSDKFDALLREFKYVTKYQDKEAFDVCFRNPFVIVPHDSKEGYHAPKILGDVFESITGALFLDSGMNLVKVWDIIHPLMADIIDEYMETIPVHPVAMFKEKYPDGKWTFKSDGEETECTVHCSDGDTVLGIGKNRKIAKATACWKAVYRATFTTSF